MDRSQDTARPAPEKEDARNRDADCYLDNNPADNNGPHQPFRSWVLRASALQNRPDTWGSRSSWHKQLTTWAHSPEMAHTSRKACEKIALTTFLAVLNLMAEHANHKDGLVAITRERIATALGCHPRTVTRAWKVLAASGWGIKLAEGHGSATTPSKGCRPAIWQLVTPRPITPTAHNVHLPPQGGISGISRSVPSNSPSARTRAPGRPQTPKPPTKPRRRAHSPAHRPPRPLPVQRLAAQLRLRCVGLNRGHVGALCDAFIAAEIDPELWSPQALRDALDADMKLNNSSWPDRIERPGAFLATRLRRLPLRPGGPPRQRLFPDPAQEQKPTWTPKRFVPTPRQPVDPAAAAAAKTYFATHRQRPKITPKPTADRTKMKRSAVALTHRSQAPTTGTCVSCDRPDATRRPFLPPTRAMVCDTCWAGEGSR